MTCDELVRAAMKEYLQMNAEEIQENGINSALMRYLTIWDLCGQKEISKCCIHAGDTSSSFSSAPEDSASSAASSASA